MRRFVLLSSLLLTLLLTAAPAAATTPSLELDVPMLLSGTPLTVNVEASNLPRGRGLVVQVMLDGRVVKDRVTLVKGANEVVLDNVRPTTGHHELTLRSARFEASTSFSLLPGWLSVVPPIVAILLALVFRDVLIALFLGIFVGALTLHGWNPFAAFARTIDLYIVPALADADHASIIVFTCLLGGMVGLITKSGGTHGIIELLTPYATTRRRGQLATWFMGLLIFFDDYANTLIVGPTMRPITDKLRISREKLAYIVDSTAAPVVCLFPISTWVGFEIGLIGNAFGALGLGVDPYTTFVASIPYRFYPIFALVLVLSIAASGYDFGPMRAAERRARRTGQLLAPGAKPIADYSSDEVEPPADAPKRA
ncbi:MAG: Na+/H+ antiporter NhaC family protein, partial [Acidobacteriota bacterium]